MNSLYFYSKTKFENIISYLFKEILLQYKSSLFANVHKLSFSFRFFFGGVGVGWGFSIQDFSL